jgi:hypothetical protein
MPEGEVRRRLFYAFVVAMLDCNSRNDSLTKHKAQTRWSERTTKIMKIWRALGAGAALIYTVHGEVQIRRVLLNYAVRDPAVGEAVRRWLAGETVAVEDVLREACRWQPLALRIYQEVCGKRINLECQQST